MILSESLEIWREKNNNGEGFAVGEDNMTPIESANAEGFDVLDVSRSHEYILCKDDDDNYIGIGDLHGPWAIKLED